MLRTVIGRNVLSRRTLAGMSQSELADKAGITRSYVSKIENGHKTIDKRSTLINLAAALECSIAELFGQPYEPTARVDLDLIAAVPLIRAALSEPEDDPAPPRPLQQLDLAVDRAMAARMDCTPDVLGEYLPGVLTDARTLWYEQSNYAGGVLFVKALVTGSLALKPAGHIDLAVRMAELADQVAAAHGDPVCIAAAQFALAQCALAVGSRRLSARLAGGGADQLDQLTRTGKLPPQLHNDVLTWMTMLRLHAALSEASLGTGDPAGHLAAADVAARGVVGNPWRMEASPGNVGVWRVGVNLEEGNLDQALNLLRRVDVNELLSPQRRARLWLDGGRAAALTGDTTTAIRYLLRADAAAPGDLRQRGTAVDLVAGFVRQASGGGSHELMDLANRVGVDPTHPEPVE
jgi:transcriptional regulator with XRE-family HTH domain